MRICRGEPATWQGVNVVHFAGRGVQLRFGEVHLYGNAVLTAVPETVTINMFPELTVS